MRYSTERRFRKYVKSYCFLSFAKYFGNKYGKKLMDAATKTGIDAAKTASKRVVQKTAEATGDLIGNKIHKDIFACLFSIHNTISLWHDKLIVIYIGNKIADEITSIGKPKEKEKTKEVEEIYIPPEKRQQIIDDLRLF